MDIYVGLNNEVWEVTYLVSNKLRNTESKRRVPIRVQRADYTLLCL